LVESATVIAGPLSIAAVVIQALGSLRELPIRQPAFIGRRLE